MFCVCVSFALTDRASTLPIDIRGCQYDTWSAGQGKIRETSTKLQREHVNKILVWFDGTIIDIISTILITISMVTHIARVWINQVRFLTLLVVS